MGFDSSRGLAAMTEYTSIRVTQEAKEAAQESKADSETWNEYLQRCTDNPPEIKEFVEAADLSDRLERIEAMTQEATNAAQSADRKLDNMGGM